jgi:hypothetical protein
VYLGILKNGSNSTCLIILPAADTYEFKFELGISQMNKLEEPPIKKQAIGVMDFQLLCTNEIKM